MSDHGPLPEAPLMGFPADNADLTAWSVAEEALIDARTYWLATVRPDGRPHVMPVWGVWLEGRFYFSTGADSRKAKNLARNANCTLALSAAGIDLSVEGTAGIETDEGTFRRFVAAYGPKYDWPMTVLDGGVYSDSGEGGPVYAVKPMVAFGFGSAADFTATRWRFTQA